jgi:outer membrane protein
MMIKKILVMAALLSVQTAFAGGLAVVDFGKAMSLVREGAKMQAELEELKADRGERLQEMEKQLMAMQADYQKQEMILSEDTRKKMQAEFMMANQEFQKAVSAAQQEVAQVGERKSMALFERLRTTTESIGKEKGYDMVIEASAVIYVGKADNITAELVTRFDAGE